MLKLSQNLGVNTEKKAFNNFSVTFDGGDEYIDCGDSAELSFTNDTTDSPFSVSLWVNFAAVDAIQWLFGKINSGNQEYFMKFHSDNYIWFRLFDDSSGGKIGVKTTGVTFATDTWYNVVATYDGSDASSGLNIYVNNVDRTSRTSSGSYTSMENTTAPLTLGVQQSTSQYFNGVLDEVTFWNIELSAAQVSTLYNSSYPVDPRGLFGVNTNLAAYWRMGDDSVHPTIIDSSMDNNDGTMTNMAAANIVADVPQQ